MGDERRRLIALFGLVALTGCGPSKETEQLKGFLINDYEGEGQDTLHPWVSRRGLDDGVAGRLVDGLRRGARPRSRRDGHRGVIGGVQTAMPITRVAEATQMMGIGRLAVAPVQSRPA